MRILLVNNFYYDRGGDCTYFFALKKLLEDKGHKVSVFSMHHPRNIDSEYSKYFVSYINYAEEVKNKNLYSAYKVLSRSIYSVEAKEKIERLIKDEQPDVIHLNNIRHHITPSILYPIKKKNIPVVWTLHDYQLICPNISFLAKGRICEKCKKRKYYWPLLVKCKKGSFLASTMAAIEHTIQMITKVYDSVDFFIAPSEFLRNKFADYEFQKNKLVLLNYFINVDRDYNRVPSGNYILYIGRLSEEKGVKTLIDAVHKANAFDLKVVGDGPLKEELILYANLKKTNNKIEFLGHRDRKEVFELLEKCKFLVIPSEWYEVTGQVIFEAFACGKPVIGSRIGGIPEFVKDNETGLTFERGNSDELAKTIRDLNYDPDSIDKMGQAGRSFALEKLNAEKHYIKLIEVYERAIESKGRKYI